MNRSSPKHLLTGLMYSGLKGAEFCRGLLHTTEDLMVKCKQKVVVGEMFLFTFHHQDIDDNCGHFFCLVKNSQCT